MILTALHVVLAFYGISLSHAQELKQAQPYVRKNMSTSPKDVTKSPPTSTSLAHKLYKYTPLWLITFLSLSIAYLIFRSYTALQLDLGTWGCRMSWMSPNYIKMDGPRREGMGGLEDKYGLWLYREGGLQGHLEVCDDQSQP